MTFLCVCVFLRFTTNRTRIEINPVRSDFVCCSSLRLFFHQATLNVSNWIKKNPPQKSNFKRQASLQPN